MPNHCLNLLTVTGASSELATFCNYALQKDKSEEDDVPYITSCPDLHYLYPIPDDIEKADDPGILSNEEYHWKVDMWGTKWNTYSDAGLSVVRSKTTKRLIGIQCEFETAWAPPDGAIRVGSKRFPNLQFTLEYAEPGMMFKGVTLMQDGKEIFDHSEMECNDEEWESATYTRMEDKFSIGHIMALREDFNEDTMMRKTGMTEMF